MLNTMRFAAMGHGRRKTNAAPPLKNNIPGMEYMMLYKPIIISNPIQSVNPSNCLEYQIK